MNGLLFRSLCQSRQGVVSCGCCTPLLGPLLGRKMRGVFCSDNMVVGTVPRSGTSKDPNMMVLLRSLSLRAARHSFAFTASHRAGRDNCIADTLHVSRFDFQPFSSSRTTCGTGCNPNPTITTGPASHNLTAKCHFYLVNGLASFTCQVYGSAPRQFLEFCSQDSPSNQNQPQLPANEQTLMRFCAHLVDQLHHMSI